MMAVRTTSKLSPMTDAKIIAFASPKGGVGKSTVCLVMGAALAYRGYPAHIVDLDQNRKIDGWNRKHHPSIPNLTIEALSEARFMERIGQLYHSYKGFVLLDLAGSLEAVPLHAATLAEVTITPSGLDAGEIEEAFKLAHHITALGAKVGKPICHRLLINRVPTLLTAGYQKAILDHDIPESGMAHFETILHARSAYPETHSTGQPPHFADRQREPIRKAVEELDALTDELLRLVLPVAELEIAA